MLRLVNKLKTIFFVIDKPIHGNVCSQEFLDIALMAAAFDLHVIVLFEGDGVNALLKNQQPETLGLKQVSPVLSALSIYDINEVLVEKESMELWRLSPEQFVIPVTSVPRVELSQQLNSADVVFSF
ncbi:MAG: sulfurtransferase complex subunit TusC [Cycloclasticus sp.]|nr:MAG: sulfurtransferase complex subunit TusC [Cycloclasticus sp.]